MSNILVTVGIALYNHEKYIIKCLESIINQTYKNIELIVIDDGSSDNSFELAKNYITIWTTAGVAVMGYITSKILNK